MEMLAYAIVSMIVSTVITMALAPKPKNADPASMDSFDFPQAEEGTAQAVVFGDCWSRDWVVIGMGNYRTDAITKSVDDGWF